MWKSQGQARKMSARHGQDQQGTRLGTSLLISGKDIGQGPDLKCSSYTSPGRFLINIYIVFWQPHNCLFPKGKSHLPRESALRERKLDIEAYQVGFISGLLQCVKRKPKIGLAFWQNPLEKSIRLVSCSFSTVRIADLQICRTAELQNCQLWSWSWKKLSSPTALLFTWSLPGLARQTLVTWPHCGENTNMVAIDRKKLKQHVAVLWH